MTARIAAPPTAVWLMTTPTRCPTEWRVKNSGSASRTVSSVCIRRRMPMRVETTAEYQALM